MNSDWLKKRIATRENEKHGAKEATAAAARRPKSALAQIATPWISVVALVFALATWVPWATQERSKRQSEYAWIVLNDAITAKSCLATFRNMDANVIENYQHFTELLEKVKRHREECRLTIEALLSRAIPASAMLDPDTARAILDVAAEHHYVWRFLTGLELGSLDADLKGKWSAHKNYLLKYARVVGAIECHRESDLGCQEVLPAKRAIAVIDEHLEANLRQYMAFKPVSNHR